jgi:energy-coupling factor transporter ATP-binding protein EcfA2
MTLITGPSGGGKSSLMREVAAAARTQGGRVITSCGALPDRPIIDLVRAPLERALATLARAGLADAALLARTPQELSEGQRLRLRLALAISKIERTVPPAIVLIDEFASTLDRATARCLCRALRRQLDQDQRLVGRLVLATAHHDVADWLEPDMVVVVPLGNAEPEFTYASSAGGGLRWSGFAAPMQVSFQTQRANAYRASA